MSILSVGAFVEEGGCGGDGWCGHVLDSEATARADLTLWRTGRELFGQMRPKSTGLGQMAGLGAGKEKERGSVIDWFNLH